MLQPTLPGQQIRQAIRVLERTFELDPEIDHAFGARRQLLANGIALLGDGGQRGEQRRRQSLCALVRLRLVTAVPFEVQARYGIAMPGAQPEVEASEPANMLVDGPSRCLRRAHQLAQSFSGGFRAEQHLPGQLQAHVAR